MRGIEIPTTLPGMVEDHARGKCAPARSAGGQSPIA
jgi:hypothetical protein